MSKRNQDFEDSNVFNVCWDISDEDGDAKNWYWWEFLPAHGGYKCIVSRSFTTASGALTPDNWIVSHPIDLTTVSSETVELNWKVRGELSGFAHEYYSVYVATGNQINDFLSSPVTQSEYVDEVGGEAAWANRSIDISSLQGNTVYIAFRHHNSSNQYSINIDDVEVRLSSSLGVDELQLESFSYFYNTSSKTLTLKSNNNSIKNVQIYNILGKSVLQQKPQELLQQCDHSFDYRIYKPLLA